MHRMFQWLNRTGFVFASLLVLLSFVLGCPSTTNLTQPSGLSYQGKVLPNPKPVRLRYSSTEGSFMLDTSQPNEPPRGNTEGRIAGRLKAQTEGDSIKCVNTITWVRLSNALELYSEDWIFQLTTIMPIIGGNISTQIDINQSYLASVSNDAKDFIEFMANNFPGNIKFGKFSKEYIEDGDTIYHAPNLLDKINVVNFSPNKGWVLKGQSVYNSIPVYVGQLSENAEILTEDNSIVPVNINGYTLLDQRSVFPLLIKIELTTKSSQAITSLRFSFVPTN